MTTYTSPAKGAILLGSLSAIGTGLILIADAQHAGGFTLDHALSLIVLTGTIGAGVMAAGSLRQGHVLEAAALGLLLLLGSWFCLTTTAGRTAETQQARALQAEAANGTRVRAKADLASADAALREARDALLEARKTGKCRICKAEQLSLDSATAAKAAAETRLSQAPAAVPVNAKVENLAEIAARLPFVTADKAAIASFLALVDPNTIAIWLELGSIVFWHIGLSRRRPSAEDALAARLAALEQAAAQAAALGGPEASPPPGGQRRPGDRANERRRQVEDFVAAYRERHGADPEPRQVREATGLPRATAWRYQRAVG